MSKSSIKEIRGGLFPFIRRTKNLQGSGINLKTQECDTSLKPKSKLRRFIDYKPPPKVNKFLNPLTKGLLKGTELAAYGTILFWIAFVKAPLGLKLRNQYGRLTGLQPKPTASANLPPKEPPNIDSFVKNYRGFEDFQAKLKSSGITPVDLDSSSYSLDTTAEINKLKKEIVKSKKLTQREKQQFINLLNEIRITSMLIWGVNTPHPYETVQAKRPNCYLMSDIQGAFQTNEKIQEIKAKVKVTDFVGEPKNFRIDTLVELSSKNIYIPFETLINWMGAKNIEPSNSTSGALSVPILTYALEKGFEEYPGMAGLLNSTTSTLLTNQDYIEIPTELLTDEDLINILSKAPKITIKLGTFQPPEQIEDIKDMFDKYDKNKETVSKEKTNAFVASTIQRYKDISTSRATSQGFKARSKSPIEKLLINHMYTVQGLKKEDNKIIVTIIDSHGYEFDLTLQDIRNHIQSIISPTDTFPDANSETYKAIFLSLLGIILINMYVRKLSKRLDSQKEPS